MRRDAAQAAGDASRAGPHDLAPSAEDQGEAGEVDVGNLPARAAFLHRPPPPANGVLRTRLTSLLDRGLQYPVSLICAPAGFGKSVVVSQFCDRSERPTAWLSVDPAIDDPRWFLMHLVAAVRRVVPEALQVTSAMATAGELPSHQSVITALSNELADLPEPITIVLDDYHHVTEPRTHQLLSDLIRHPSPLVHLMIISREEPPLAIPKLRAQGRLSEIRMADLAFSEDELKRFMESELSQTLTAEQLDHIYASTEGWPAGARLAAQAFRLKGGAIVGAGFLDHAAQEYLLADVLDRAPDDVQRHLFAVSHVDQFSAALCDAISSDAFPNDLPGSEFIAWLRQHDLFLVQLDGAGNWYRFHHLFAGLLQHWRTTSKFADEAFEQQIHEGAATALVDQGRLDDAIEQLELAGAHGELAATAATQGARLVEEERWVELARLISVIPSSVLDTDPNLLILHAWSLGEVRNRFSAMSDVLDRAEALLDEPGNVDAPTDRWLRGQITVLRGAYLKLLGSDLDGAIADAQAAQGLLSDLPGRHLTMAYVLEVVALASAGRSEEAHQVADAVVGDPRFSDAPFDPMSWSLPYIGWMEGDLDSEKRHALRLLAIGEQFGLESTILAANCFLGTVAYERNQLGEAERRLTYVFNRRYVAVANDAAHAGMALVSTQMALRRTTAADATAETLAQFVLETHSEFLQPYIDAFIAELDLRRGRTGSGLRWARSAELATQRYGYMWYNPGPVQIEVLLASRPDAEQGRELLDHVLETARDRNHRPVMIRLLGLRALDLAERDDEAGALDALDEAVRLAQPGGIVRRLADLGPRLIPLLQRLDVAADVLDHAGAILAAIETPNDQPSDAIRLSAIDPSLGLTAREADVLRLLAARFSNKEIARELIIAPATVKKHTVTLYDKLNVHSRREAVAKALTLGYVDA